MNTLDTIYKNSNTPSEYSKNYCLYLKDLLSTLDYNKIGEMIILLQQAAESEKFVFFIGNGGSASTAAHFANDLAVGIRHGKKKLKAIDLTSNNSIITALGNDDGYENIYIKQLETYMSSGDYIVAISASGNSPNIIKAVEYAKSINGIVVGLTGFDGGKLKSLSDLSLHIETPKGEYGPVEDIHMVLDHLIGSYLAISAREYRRESICNGINGIFRNRIQEGTSV